MQVREPPDCDPGVRFVSLPRQPVDARRSVPLQFEEGLFQRIDADVVEERGEPILLPFPCRLPYAIQGFDKLSRVTRLPGSVSGACRPVPRFPRSPPLAPPAPPPVARLRSSASQLLWRGLTSHARSSSATAPRLPDADRPASPELASRPARHETSRFPCKELTHMPGSSTTRDRGRARVDARPRFAFRYDNGVGVPIGAFAARWLAYAHPCRRFTHALADTRARLGADAVR